jgi:DNA-binding response OmpR family regulator
MARVVDLGQRARFRLGSAEVFPSACEIAGPGGRLTLEPRVMQVLVALADANGETVTRDDLIETCGAAGSSAPTQSIGSCCAFAARNATSPPAPSP